MTNTESQTRNKFAAGLRQLYRWYWPAKRNVIGLAKYRMESDRRWYVDCEKCGTPLLLKEAEVDHIVEIGLQPDLIAGEIGPYCDRLFCAEEGLQILCKECHRVKTNEGNKANREKRKQIKFNFKEVSEKEKCKLNQTSASSTKRAVHRARSKRKR